MTRQRGMVLLAVLVIAAVAGMVAVTVMFRLRAEAAAGGGDVRATQARLAALSGINQAVAQLATTPYQPDRWQDNPTVFENQLVVDNGSNKWYFTVYAPNPSNSQQPRFGVIDEGGKIDLNTADASTLQALPGMTQTLAANLLAWRGSKAQNADAGEDYYQALPQPYAMRDGTLATVDEMLLVKGFNGPILFGEDANLNGILDPNEDDGSDSFPPDNADGVLNPGLKADLTVWSKVPNVDAQGKPRVKLNGAVRAINQLPLSAKTIKFIKTYLGDGNTFTDPSQLLKMTYQPRPSKSDKHPAALKSGVGADELAVVMDRLTTAPSTLVGRVNVNTAPADVLAALPGMGSDTAKAIVSARANLAASDRQTIAWLYTQNVLTADQFKNLAPLLSARSGMVRVRCVGFGVPCGQFCTLEAVIDLTQTPPAIVYLRDLTKLGLPVNVDTAANQL